MSKKLLTVFLLILVIPLFFACANGSQEAGNNEPTVTPGTNPDTESGSETASAAVIYFSATNNTEAIAQHLETILGVTATEIVPAIPYTSADLNYRDSSSRSQQEQHDSSARPAIENDLSAAVNADVIYLGYPIWNGYAPRIINTFLDTYGTALAGKAIYLFCTSASSPGGSSVSALQESYPTLNIVSGQRFAIGSSETTVANWVNSL